MFAKIPQTANSRKENNTYNLTKQIRGGGRGRIQDSTYVGIKIYLNPKSNKKVQKLAKISAKMFAKNVYKLQNNR